MSHSNGNNDPRDPLFIHIDLQDMYDKKLYAVLHRQAMTMRNLLHTVNEATGPGANGQALPDALKAISDYLDNLPK